MPKARSKIEVAGVELPKVSGANTKAEILDAYQTVVSKFEEKASHGLASPKAAAEELRRVDDVLERARATTVEGVIRNVAELKLELGAALDRLTEKLASATEQYAVLQEALDLGAGRLENIYDIRVTADALALLIKDYETQSEELRHTYNSDKAALEAEIARTRESWAAERSEHQARLKARDLSLEEARQREQEEYEYGRDRERQRDTDAYSEEKTALEKELTELRASQEAELAERERRVAEREDEVEKLSKAVSEFDKRLEVAVKQAVTDAESRLRAQANVAADLAEQKATSAGQLAELRVQTLQQTISEKDARIAELQKQVEEATQKVSEIALQAIEGASGSKALKHVNQIALEQAKQRKKE